MSKKPNIFDNSNLQGKEQWGNIELPGLTDEELHTDPKLMVRLENKRRKNDPKWLEANKKAMENRSEEWLENTRKGVKKREQNKEYIEYRQSKEYKDKLSQGHQRSFEENPELREKFSKKSKEIWSKPEVKEKLSNTLKELWKDAEYKKKMATRKPRPGKKMMTPWGQFNSRIEALEKMKELGLKSRGTTLDRGFKEDPDNFYTIDE